MADTSNFEAIFERLKQIMQPFEERLALQKDAADVYYLNTHLVGKNKKPIMFGGVEINKNYVSYHLFPLYVCPEMIGSLSEGLKKRMQGKTCFNFKVVDETLLNELSKLTEQGFERFQQPGLIAQIALK